MCRGCRHIIFRLPAHSSAQARRLDGGVTVSEELLLAAANLLLDGLRNRLVVRGLHAVHATALRTGTQRGGVTEHLSQRNHRVNHRGAARDVLHALDAAAASVQVADVWDSPAPTSSQAV